MHKFDNSILRKYDIRGTWKKNLDEKDAYYLGLSFARFLKKKCLQGDVYIGYDGRFSSPIIKKNLIKGLIQSGISIVEIGLVPTPVLYFACHFFTSAVAGIMVTGSHNEPQDNGFKMVIAKDALHEDDIFKLAKIAENGNFILDSFQGKHIKKNITQNYIKRIIEANLSLTKRKFLNSAIRVAWDPGNGAASEMLHELTKLIPGEHILINDKIDANFSAHSPDPTQPANLKQLISVVKENKCDVGVAFDGDADRIIAVDSLGNILYGDQLLMIFAQDFLKRNRGSIVIGDIKTSDVVFQKIKEWGGEPMIWKTGHSLIKSKMKESSSLLAGEVSGHIFFGENYYGFDDALFAAVKLVFLLAQQSDIFKFIDSFPRPIATHEVRISCKDSVSVIKKIKTLLDDSNIKYNNLDGVKVSTDNGWWLVRASNTQECLVIKVEGIDAANLLSLGKNLIDIFLKIRINIALKDIGITKKCLI